MTSIRQPAVAGYFYPEEANQLGVTVAGLLDAVPPQAGPAPKALIVPHAGYVYSGPVAATAYARLKPWRNRYRRVVLLGTAHRIPVSGLAASGARFFRTPLGDVPVDHDAIDKLDLPEVTTFDSGHEFEHSLEVQLPFLQTVMDSFSLLPLVIGDANAKTVAKVIDALWGGAETLIIVSSDLSHYLNYEEARAMDAGTCRAIENLKVESLDLHRACGSTPIAGLLIAAKQRAMTMTTLDLRNSGDTAGGRGQVVGYGAWLLSEDGGNA